MFQWSLERINHRVERRLTRTRYSVEGGHTLAKRILRQASPLQLFRESDSALKMSFALTTLVQQGRGSLQPGITLKCTTHSSNGPELWERL